MTTPRYASMECSAGSQVRGEAVAWSSASAFGVNFNNGNVNNNHRNNNGFGLPVRRVAGEYQGEDAAEVTFRELFDAFRRARKGKEPSLNQLRFETNWIGGLLELQAELNGGTWSPRPTTCFIASRPKAREIHAPDFADRVVHHWLVPPLEAVYEPIFIYDSYANRVGKGTHAAVRRVQQFVRQVQSGQGDGWYLQLDIRNCFNCVNREILYGLLKPRMQRAGLSLPIQRAVHALLRRSPLAQGVNYRAAAEERAQVPPHKRLENAPPGCGIAIGNLSSQFFVNVYLNELDQFVKHTLGVKRYLRYVDDFVLVHQDRAQLEAWRVEIERFLGDRLELSLKADQRLRPLKDGIDFLGYVIRPTHTLVRRRVVAHAMEALSNWEREHVGGGEIRTTPADLRALIATSASYTGHLKHASTVRLAQALHRRFPWLESATVRRRFPAGMEGETISIPFSHSATKGIAA